MKMRDFPYCCTAKVVVDFGESNVAAGGNRAVTVDEIMEYIKKQMAEYRFHAFFSLALRTL